MSYIGNPLQSTDFVTESFTGTGSATAFNLTRVPASASAIQVFVNGLKINPFGGSGSYTLVGNVINFLTAPANGALIEVLHLGVQSVVNIPASATVTANSLAAELRNVYADQFTANGTGTTFTLTTAPISANSLIVTANGVVQFDYSVSGSTLILNFTPANGTVIRAAGMGNILTTGTITDGSVSTAKLQDDSVTNAKLALTYTSQANTGNGTGQTYTIASGHTANSILVFYNGLALLPVVDYSVSGTTLTLTFAPINNSNVSIRYLPV